MLQTPSPNFKKAKPAENVEQNKTPTANTAMKTPVFIRLIWKVDKIPEPTPDRKTIGSDPCVSTKDKTLIAMMISNMGMLYHKIRK